MSVSSEGSVTSQTSRLVNISRYVKGEEGLWVERPGERVGVGSGGGRGRKEGPGAQGVPAPAAP